jgi:hypothetical protein
MARGTTLADLLVMVKAECGYNLQGVATAQDQELKALLSNMQLWLWSQYQWPFLYTHADVGATAGGRYLNFPAGLSFDYPTEAETKWGDLWYDVAYGIKGEQYEAVDPDRGQFQDPIERWQNYSATQFEVWPVPSDAQTLRFWGTATLPDLKVDSDVAALDDLLIVLFTAAEKLGRSKQKDAQNKLQRAQALFNKLRGANRPNTCFTLGGDVPNDTHSRNVRFVTMVGNPNH